MGKSAITIMLAVMTACTVQAQYYIAVSDTVVGRNESYYYGQWYDECPWFQSSAPSSYNLSGMTGYLNWSRLACVEHAERRMAVKGIAAMVKRIQDYDAGELYFNTPSPVRNEEYLYLCAYDSVNMPELASARWDTVTPRLWTLPKTLSAMGDGDSSDFMYCHVYEVLFDKPVLVDSTFIMAGTFNSNKELYIHSYLPTMYLQVVERYNVCGGMCPGDTVGSLHLYADSIARYLEYVEDGEDIDAFIDSIRWARLDVGRGRAFGPFFAIVDYYQLDVQSCDNAMGSVIGGGIYPAMSLDTIRAVPCTGFRFVQWGDGVTDNPRVVELTQDTLIVATFVNDGDEAIPSVEGATLQFTAVPNPTSGVVSVGVPSDGSYHMALYDMAGRCLKQEIFSGCSVTLEMGDLPAGSYQLTLRKGRAYGIKVIMKQ